ncbi:MAG: prenyltransferase [Desulfobacterales bacterium]|nr:prenyltransferase [Desulfobacterales bacterium]
MDQGKRFIKIWGAQIRGNFLILSVLLVCIGLSLAWKYMCPEKLNFNFIHAGLLVFGVVLTHISVNLFNEYSDYKTKIDFNTERTPFSGGSGMMQAELTRPAAVLGMAIASLFIALVIGIYFCAISHWLLIFIVIMGGIAVVFYTSFMAKILLGEFVAGATLGSFVVLGTFIAMTGSRHMPVNGLLPMEIVLVSIPPGILTFLLLLLNEFPDVEADKKGGRFHLVIWLGRKKASYLYALGLIMVYATIIISPLLGLTTWWIYIALLTLPLAVKAGIMTAKNCEDMQKLVPAQGLNVLVVLATDALIAVAFLIVTF